MTTPEDKAREYIDALLEKCGWVIQNKNAANLSANRGVALRELSFKTGEPDDTLLFDRKPSQEKPWTEMLWIYDFRTNKHFTLKENQLKRSDLDDFVACYHVENRHQRKETERFKCFNYDDLIKRDKVNLDIFWLKDDSLEDFANLPAPDVIAAEIVEELEAALEQFAEMAEDLSGEATTESTGILKVK